MQALRQKVAEAGSANFHSDIVEFAEFGTRTIRSNFKLSSGIHLPVYTNEYWTARQRAANALHEISYRACFKPQLPAFFIERFSAPGDIVYDPFAGRGTTLIESALRNRIPYGCDINPLSELLIRPRIEIPDLEEVAIRLERLKFHYTKSIPKELLVFFHKKTLKDLCGLREYLLSRQRRGTLDAVDRWIWMVALNRLTGHSPGFFSIYTMPPNQAVSVEAQQKINEKLNQKPEHKNIRELILKKSQQLLKDCRGITAHHHQERSKAKIFIGSADAKHGIRSSSVQLVVTSPPFLDVVNYVQDNWIRAWFAGVKLEVVPVWQFRKLDQWTSAMSRVFGNLNRVLKTGGHVAFEVGEVRNGSVRLEETVAEIGLAAGLRPVCILLHKQKFTKTSNCWGVSNQRRGTNSNRVVLFEKPERSRLRH